MVYIENDEDLRVFARMMDGYQKVIPVQDLLIFAAADDHLLKMFGLNSNSVF